MRKLFYLGFALVLAAGVGCAITDYGLITDNDQVANGQGSGIVNTNGKAHLREGSQIATLWPDGADELFSFADQKANGDKTLTTYDNFSSAYPIFHSDFYCNPDWSGCAVSTSDDPLVGDASIFDYSANFSCKGSRSLSLLVSSTRYYGECGRAKLKTADILAFANMGSPYGDNGLQWNLNPQNSLVKFEALNNGRVAAQPLTFDSTLQITNRKGTLDLSSPAVANFLNRVRDILRDQGEANTVTFQYNNVSRSANMKVLTSALANRIAQSY